MGQGGSGVSPLLPSKVDAIPFPRWSGVKLTVNVLEWAEIRGEFSQSRL